MGQFGEAQLFGWEWLVQRILIVEDRATSESILASSLGELEFDAEIIEAESGLEALRFWSPAPFDGEVFRQAVADLLVRDCEAGS
jgi:CheY-like chemotaxis protein